MGTDRSGSSPGADGIAGVTPVAGPDVDAPAGAATSVSAALVCTLVVLVYAVADATLLFGAAFPERVSTGFGMALVGYAIAAAAVGLGSGLRGTVAGTQEVTLVMLAVLVADIKSGFPAGTAPDTVFLTALAAVVATGLAVGAACHLAARFRVGRFVHYLPWPVVAGLLAGSGVALALAALPILTGRESLGALAASFEAGPDGLALGLGAAAAGALALAQRHRVPHAALVAVLVLGYLAWRGVAHLAGADLADLRADGWTLARAPEPTAWPPPGLDGLSGIDWSQLLARTPFIGATVLITLVAALVQIGAVAQLLDRDVDEGRELRAAGTANLLAGGAFGLPGFHTASLTQIALRMKAASPLTALLVAALTLAALPFAGAALAHAPRFLVGGVLLWVGIDLVVTWLIVPRASLSTVELGIVTLITATITAFGFLPGLTAGLVCTLVLFVLDYGRGDVLRGAVAGSDLRSNVDRSAAEHELLTRRADELLVLRLHGYLFFGTAHRLVEQLRARLDGDGASGPALRYLIVDFERVTGLDASALQALGRLRALAHRRGIAVDLSGLSAPHRAALADPGAAKPRDRAPSLASASLDEALQRREDAVLTGLAVPPGTDPAPSGPGLDAATLRRLTRYADTIEIEPGRTLLHRGYEVGALYLVREGRLGVRVSADGREVRLRSVGAGALLGELSFYLGRPASADVVAETRCRLWRLTSFAFERILREDPTLASRFHRHAAAVLAERLADNARQIRLLSG